MYEDDVQLKIDKLLDSLENEYNYYTSLGNKALEKGNFVGANLHFIEASAFGRAKFIAEDILF